MVQEGVYMIIIQLDYRISIRKVRTKADHMFGNPYPLEFKTHSPIWKIPNLTIEYPTS